MFAYSYFIFFAGSPFQPWRWLSSLLSLQLVIVRRIQTRVVRYGACVRDKIIYMSAKYK